MVYHGIIVDKSLMDQKIPSSLRMIGKHKSSNDEWVLYKVEIEDNELEDTIKLLQNALVPGSYYFHFYNDKGDDLRICYENKIFRASSDKSTWKDAIEYGKNLNIPERQLDFYPSKFIDETY